MIFHSFNSINTLSYKRSNLALDHLTRNWLWKCILRIWNPKTKNCFRPAQSALKPSHLTFLLFAVDIAFIVNASTNTLSTIIEKTVRYARKWSKEQSLFTMIWVRLSKLLRRTASSDRKGIFWNFSWRRSKRKCRSSKLSLYLLRACQIGKEICWLTCKMKRNNLRRN